ncbi:hypothetical protein C5167_011501 [Papaver somniferum]|uniref:Uncharacterized protein n=1 Tax=Papaver somniferum TaxID=3469 RepID=A0A4Y7K3B2_PAPSO|nr:hypothetical protein C5167_011501 [Papaver somniferum]
MVIIAHDVESLISLSLLSGFHHLVVWLPALCRKMEIPYAII